MNKDALIDTLSRWIHQRPGLEPANYISGWNDSLGRSAYRSDARSITRDLHHARELLRYVAARDSITAERILDACKHNFAGRLTIKPARAHKCECGHKWSAPVELSNATPNLSGEKTQWCPKCGSRPSESSAHFYEIDYCTGQYWPTEYRRAACAVLAGAVWGWLRDECIKSTDGMQAGNIRKAAAREFSRPVARRWFN